MDMINAENELKPGQLTVYKIVKYNTNVNIDQILSSTNIIKQYLNNFD